MRKRKTTPPSGAMVPGKKLYTIEEAAWAMSLGRNSLYELVLRGKIASVKIGTLRRVPVEALDAFIQQQTQQQ